jgi:four helix bundle protein
MAHNYKDLKIWQRSIELVDFCYDYVGDLPQDERFNLKSQIIRCGCSIPTNVAEGCGKRTPNHFAEFLSTSFGSSFELETHLVICERRKFGNPELRIELTEKITELKNMIYNFREKIINESKS